MDIASKSPRRLALRAVLKDVSPIVARLVSVPESYEIRQLHEVFMAMLDWRCDPDFIIRVHGAEFASFRRCSRGTYLRDFQHARVAELLSDVLPVSPTLNPQTIQNHLHACATQLEDELGDEGERLFEGTVDVVSGTALTWAASNGRMFPLTPQAAPPIAADLTPPRTPVIVAPRHQGRWTSYALPHASRARWLRSSERRSPKVPGVSD